MPGPTPRRMKTGGDVGMRGLLQRFHPLIPSSRQFSEQLLGAPGGSPAAALLLALRFIEHQFRREAGINADQPAHGVRSSLSWARVPPESDRGTPHRSARMDRNKTSYYAQNGDVFEHGVAACLIGRMISKFWIPRVRIRALDAMLAASSIPETR
jgi:hypothetical protein